jgi:predicted dithiol-disulfide oxidoreductase (DUF899 family)
MADLHDKHFPGEDPSYRQARNSLLEAELALEEQVRKVADMRQALPAGGPVSQDYAFDTLEDGRERTIRMSELFEPGKPNLFLYSFMFGPDDEKPCPACTSLVDGFNGVSQHIQDRTNMAIVAKAPVRRLTEFAATRGWSAIRLLSSANNSYNQDYFAETPVGNQIPAANIFTRHDGEIRHFYNTEMLYVDQPGRHPRHVDRIWPVWNLLDMTPEGRGDWGPKLEY